MQRVMVVNTDNTFLSYTTIKRANFLYNVKKVAVAAGKNIEYYTLKTIDKIYKIPSILRLMTYIRRMYQGSIPPVKQNIFVRDNCKCCYCGKKLYRDQCTIDHIIPKAKGGRDTWENMVTSCSKCNIEKGGLTPKEAKMKMEYQPFQPTIMQFVKMKNKILGIQSVIDSLEYDV